MQGKRPVLTSVTLADVAKEAGVSLATAARVLRGSSYPVSSDLAQRVQGAAKKLGYVPNLLARNLRGQAKGSLGLIVGSMREPYFGEIADFVTTGAFERSVLAMVANMHRDPLLEIAMCRKLLEHRVGGLILAGGGFDQSVHFKELLSLVKQLQETGIVVVSLSERKLPIPAFSVDNGAVGRLLATEALRRGHTNIGVVSGSGGSFVTQGRLKGLRSILRAAGVKESLVYTPEITLEGGGQAVDELLRIDPCISVVLAATDTLGVGAIMRLQKRGRKVPFDVSVISVGNTGACELSSPRLSSVDTSLVQCCEAAIDHIVSVWAGSGPPVPRTFLARLVPRDSSS
jgi:LacI family transcriptional regulator